MNWPEYELFKNPARKNGNSFRVKKQSYCQKKMERAQIYSEISEGPYEFEGSCSDTMAFQQI